jgi:hypothetical protein
MLAHLSPGGQHDDKSSLRDTELIYTSKKTIAKVCDEGAL